MISLAIMSVALANFAVGWLGRFYETMEVDFGAAGPELPACECTQDLLPPLGHLHATGAPQDSLSEI
jgi:hypothetical protein